METAKNYVNIKELMPGDGTPNDVDHIVGFYETVSAFLKNPPCWSALSSGVASSMPTAPPRKTMAIR